MTILLTVQELVLVGSLAHKSGGVGLLREKEVHRFLVVLLMTAEDGPSAEKHPLQGAELHIRSMHAW